MGSILAQYLPRVLKAFWKAFSSLRGEVSFEESWMGWAECGLLVMLGLAEGMGWKWEGGLVDGCVEEYLGSYEAMVSGKGGKAEEDKGFVFSVTGPEPTRPNQ